MPTNLSDRDRRVLTELARLAPTFRSGVVLGRLCGRYATNTLRSLERRGLVKARTLPHKGYSITDAGKAALPLTASACACGDRTDVQCVAFDCRNNPPLPGEDCACGGIKPGHVHCVTRNEFGVPQHAYVARIVVTGEALGVDETQRAQEAMSKAACEVIHHGHCSFPCVAVTIQEDASRLDAPR